MTTAESDSMQEAGARALTVTTPGERHRTAPSTTALHILATCGAIPPCCDLPPAMPTLLSADPCVWMLPRQVTYARSIIDQFKAFPFPQVELCNVRA
jgi:hypothetical protein